MLCMCVCVDFHMCSLVLLVGVRCDYSQRHEDYFNAEIAHATLRATEKAKEEGTGLCKTFRPRFTQDNLRRTQPHKEHVKKDEFLQSAAQSLKFPSFLITFMVESPKTISAHLRNFVALTLKLLQETSRSSDFFSQYAHHEAYF